MAPANDAVFLRRNNQVQDAIDGQNLKQALQLVEKRMKKGEDTRFLKVCRSTCHAIDSCTALCPSFEHFKFTTASDRSPG